MRLWLRAAWLGFWKSSSSPSPSPPAIVRVRAWRSESDTLGYFARFKFDGVNTMETAREMNFCLDCELVSSPPPGYRLDYFKIDRSVEVENCDRQWA